MWKILPQYNQKTLPNYEKLYLNTSRKLYEKLHPNTYKKIYQNVKNSTQMSNATFNYKLHTKVEKDKKLTNVALVEEIILLTTNKFSPTCTTNYDQGLS